MISANTTKICSNSATRSKKGRNNNAAAETNINPARNNKPIKKALIFLLWGLPEDRIFQTL